MSLALPPRPNTCFELRLAAAGRTGHSRICRARAGAETLELNFSRDVYAGPGSKLFPPLWRATNRGGGDDGGGDFDVWSGHDVGSAAAAAAGLVLRLFERHPTTDSPREGGNAPEGWRQHSAGASSTPVSPPA